MRKKIIFIACIVCFASNLSAQVTFTYAQRRGYDDAIMGTIINGSNIEAKNAKSFNLEAIPSSSLVKSVKFVFTFPDGQIRNYIDPAQVHFSLYGTYGNYGTDFNNGPDLGPGIYKLDVTGYSYGGGLGTVLATNTITFTVVEGNVVGGTNSWIFHTPEGSKNLYLAPKKTDGTWDWSVETTFFNDGKVNIPELYVKNDIHAGKDVSIDGEFLTFIGLNNNIDWGIHSPLEKQPADVGYGSLFFAPKIANEWQWNSQVEITKEGNLIVNGNIGVGTRNSDNWKLAVNGNIRAKGIKVETDWADFVFDDAYCLPTLEEVEQHIEERGHLKDIPSAKEVEENGINLGEMNKLLLQKIEELTLYIIQQKKQSSQQESLIKTLEEQNNLLMERFNVLEALILKK